MLHRVQRFDLALADEQRRVWFFPPLGVGADHQDAGRSGQLAQLEHLLFDGGHTLILVIKGHQVGAFLPAVGIPNQLASAVIIPTRRRSTIISRSAGLPASPNAARNPCSWQRARSPPPSV